MIASTESRSGTRTRIQDVALDLFTERGYNATSLREIAERLGVTKAALYYHFKSKEEIVESMVADHVAMVGELLDWGAGIARTPEGRREFLRRYAEDIHSERHRDVVRFFQQNQPAIKHTPSGHSLHHCLRSVIDLLTDPQADHAERLRTGLAVMALHGTWMLLPDEATTDEQRRQAALTVALDLLR